MRERRELRSSLLLNVERGAFWALYVVALAAAVLYWNRGETDAAAIVAACAAVAAAQLMRLPRT
ncbi:hypothetical protein [Allonocardiopsis opalescens]|uniref:Uncharacterized protein n=1 Tax=Allonocardiopsis opalescens TaxID=1144618 RepID=A0A2T0Q165_9ACTN|nr:hypothetical protein [Allonocardiopsis opalescens]PRX97423.1 hypothetical protein CLV72_106462 [Allonocardiopsis opalescens]